MLQHKTLAYAGDGAKRPECRRGLFFTVLKKGEERKGGPVNTV
jgi:hypothetical protein